MRSVLETVLSPDTVEDIYEWLAETGEVPPHLGLEGHPPVPPHDEQAPPRRAR